VASARPVARALLGLLADPVDGAALREAADGTPEAGDGWLEGGGGRRYAVRDGIPRFVESHDAGQDQTGESFGWKWAQRDAYERPGMLPGARAWLLHRYGFETAAAMRACLGERRVLDLGCGAGFSAALWLGDDERDPFGGTYIGADLSSAVDVARDRLGGRPNRHFVQADALALPFARGAVDVVIAEGVLHHTPSTRAALASAVSILRPGGEVWCYVYRRKSPLREYADDFVRDQIAPLPPEQAWELMRPLTLLGKALEETGAVVTVPEDVSVLGIPAGTYPVQRLFYWHVAKVFWNADWGLDASQLTNFDWYHPRYAHRQSEDEVRAWCGELGLAIEHFDVDDAGYTVRARLEREP
jgi:arsenite methyltransferase